MNSIGPSSATPHGPTTPIAERGASWYPLVLLTVLLLTRPAPADDAHVRQALQPLYDRCCRCTEQGQSGPILALMAPDYTEVGMDGSQGGLDQVKSELEGVMRALSHPRASARIISVESHRGWAKVVVDSTLTGETMGLQPCSPRRHFESRNRSEDTWTQTPKGWKMERSRILQQQVLVNGHPL